MKKQTVLILGGGFSGVVTALWIDHLLGDRVSIVLGEQGKTLFPESRSRHSVGPFGHQMGALAELIDGLPPSGIGAYWSYPSLEEEAWIEILLREAGVEAARISVLQLAEVLKRKLNESLVTVYTNRKGTEWRVNADQRFCMWFKDGNPIEADYLVFAVGGGRPNVLKGLSEYGISFNEPLPGFRELRIDDNQWKGVSKVSFNVSKIKLIFEKDEYKGIGGGIDWNYPYIGGSAISRATAKWAEVISEHKCAGILEMVLLPEGQFSVSSKDWMRFQSDFGSREVGMAAIFELPLSLWRALLSDVGIPLDEAWNKLDAKRLARLGSRLIRLRIPFRGYRLNREEHLSVGGVPANHLKMDYMESLKQPNLFFCGEVVDLRMPPGGAGYLYGLWSGLRVGAAIAERLNTLDEE